MFKFFKEPFSKFIFICLCILVAICIAIVFFSSEANSTFKDSSAAIGFATAAALLIERIIEIFWTFMGGHKKNTLWPLNTASKQIESFVDQLNKDLEDVYYRQLDQFVDFKKEVSKTANYINKSVDDTEKYINKGIDEINKMKAEFDKFSNLLKEKETPNVERAEILSSRVTSDAQLIKEKYDLLSQYIEESDRKVKNTLDALHRFILSFKSNPARRLISLFAGFILGLIIAGIFGIDLISAVLETNEKTWWNEINIPIIITGLILGAGATPTHEVIKFLQENKESIKKKNFSKIFFQSNKINNG